MDPIGNAHLPFVALLATPPDPFIRGRGYATRGEITIQCRMPLLGYLGVYDCEVVHGSEFSHSWGLLSPVFGINKPFGRGCHEKIGGLIPRLMVQLRSHRPGFSFQLPLTPRPSGDKNRL